MALLIHKDAVQSTDHLGVFVVPNVSLQLVLIRLEDTPHCWLPQPLLTPTLVVV